MDTRDKNYILSLIVDELNRLDIKHDRLIENYVDECDMGNEWQANVSIEYCRDHIAYVFNLMESLIGGSLNENEYMRHGTPYAGDISWGVYTRSRHIAKNVSKTKGA